MKSFVRSLPLSSLLAVRQLHLGRTFPILAKRTSGESGTLGSKEAQKTKSLPEELKKPLNSGVTSFSKKILSNGKISAAVRASLLSKETLSTEQVPEELRNPSEAMAACSVTPRRSELDQRQERKTQYASQLQELITHQKTSSEATVQCVPFVKMSPGTDNRLRRCYETAEELLAQESNPLKLAKALIKVRRELQAEKEKSDAITEMYLDLKAELYAIYNERKATAEGEPTAKASSSFSQKPGTKKTK